MFQPTVFKEDRVPVMHSLIRECPFATIVSSASGTLTAEHVPLVLQSAEGGQGVLQGHLNVGNPLVRNTSGPFEVLAIFQGPQTYVTPSWYASKAEHGKVVPTWNYVVVHARGQLRFIRDHGWLRSHLESLTAQFESGRAAPWAVSDAPRDFIGRQLNGLAGFEIEIAVLDGTWKVSQNKGPADRLTVEAGLRAEGDPEKARMAACVAQAAGS